MTSKQKAEATEVATTEKNEVSTYVDYGTHAGDGLQDVSTEEVGIPFLSILQAQSPAVIGPDGKVEGAQAGMFINSATQELSERVLFVPSLRQHVFVEWRPRKQGGGRVGTYTPDDAVVAAAIKASDTFGKYKTEAGNDLVETFYVFGIVCDIETSEPQGMAVLAFTSTGISKYKKRFMHRIKYCAVPSKSGPITPPIYAHRVVLSTEQQTNDEGTWFNYAINFLVENNPNKSLLKPDAAAFQAAHALKVAVEAGEKSADFDAEDRGSAGTSAEDGSGTGKAVF